MLGYWLAAGSPHYEEMGANQKIAYISDIGATFLKPLFIAGSTVMVVIFDLAFISERWLRHKGRLTPNYSKWEAFLSVCSIIAAIIGAAGLILLTIFDTKHYPVAHDVLLGVFMYLSLLSPNA
jgi:nitrate reductase gamma subunit